MLKPESKDDFDLRKMLFEALNPEEHAKIKQQARDFVDKYFDVSKFEKPCQACGQINCINNDHCCRCGCQM